MVSRSIYFLSQDDNAQQGSGLMQSFFTFLILKMQTLVGFVRSFSSFKIALNSRRF